MRELSYSEIKDQTGAFVCSIMVSAVCGIIIALTAPANDFLRHGTVFFFIPAICLIVMFVICYFEYKEVYLLFIPPLICGTVAGYALSYSIIFWIKVIIIAISPFIIREFFKPKNALN